MYVTIEGVIGSGKTSLTDLLSEKLDACSVYEIIEENPYLENFYEDQDKYAFQTEMFFLTDRCNQMKEIESNFLTNGEDVIADYNLAKSLIFAKKTLDKAAYDKFYKIYHILVEDFFKPDLIIIIKSDINTLKKHIEVRNREFEQQIEDEYLNYLIDKYDEYIAILKRENPDKLLLIDGEKLDFVNNAQDREYVLNSIFNKLGLKC